MKVQIETKELERVMQGIYDAVTPGKLTCKGDIEAIRTEVQQGLDEVVVELEPGFAAETIHYRLTTPSRLLDLLESLKEWQGGPGFVAFYGQRLAVLPMKLPPGAPAPRVITTAKELRELYGWTITDEEFERRFKANPVLSIPIDPKDLARVEGWVSDSLAAPVIATMDPNDPKRVLVEMPAPPEWPADVGTTAQEAVDGLAEATPDEVAAASAPGVAFDPVRGRVSVLLGAQPLTVVLTCTKNNRGTQFGLAFPNEASEAWAKENAPALRQCMDSFTNRYAWRTLVENDQKSSNPIAVTVKEMFADLRGLLLTAFHEAGLVIEEQAS